MLIFVAVTAILSIIYAVQVYVGGPLRVGLTSEINDLALYRSGALKYVHWTGGAWEIQTVDDLGNVGQYASLALDSAGNPHMSYYDAVTGALRYARQTGRGWDVQTVDSQGGVGAHSSLVLDSADKPHISYCRYDAVDQTCSGLKYAHYDGSAWITMTVDPAIGTGQYSSLALDYFAQPHIGYYDSAGGVLRYAHLSGTVWLSETVDSAGNAGLYTSLALDSIDKPHISYQEAASGVLRYAHLSGTVWLAETVDSALGVGEYTALILDSADNPHMSYYAAHGALRYARWTGGGWDIQTVDSENAGQYSSLALDKSDQPHISYYDAANGALKYARWTGGDWDVQTVDNTGDVGRHSSLILDGYGDPHLTYYSSNAIVAAGTQEGTVRWWDIEAKWATRTLPGSASPVVRVAFDPFGSTLISVSSDGMVRLWHMPGGALRQEFDVGEGGRCVASH